MLARASNRHLVEDLEEVKVERVGECLGAALLGGKLGPDREGALSALEHVLNVGREPQLLRPPSRISLIGKPQLVAKITEAVVDGGRGEHENLGGDPTANDVVDQTLIAVLGTTRPVILCRGCCVFAVTEVVRLVNDNEVISAPVDRLQVHARDGLAPLAREVGVIEHVVAETIAGYGIVDLVVAVHRPVVRKFLGTKDEHIAVQRLIVLDDSERRERLAKAYAVGEDAAIVGLELVDDGKNRVPLKVI